MKPAHIVLIGAVSILTLTLSTCKYGRMIVHGHAEITDHEIFPARTAQKSETPFRFEYAENGKVPREINVEEKRFSFESFLEKNNTVAFLIIQNDTIQYENYWADYKDSSIVPSFSMAKSILSILIGCAVEDGLIQSVQDPVTDYVLELKKNGFDRVTVEHLLQMTSGLKFDEGYGKPFGHVASFYYGKNLRQQTLKLKLNNEPGEQFEYVSGNSQLLGMVLERALTEKTITEYLEEKIWKKIGTEYDATWSIDNDEGIEKTFCCLNARARDFAKIGRLYLNGGSWNGEQVVPESWVVQSTKTDSSNGSVPYYQYQWWFPSPHGDFMAQGILGQYIYVHPEKNLIVVRLGKNEGEADWGSVLAGLGRIY